MTNSASSASSLDSHAPSESSGQSQGLRWEEQQKVLALEQLCGVFRVDLGHMRSLRLFFRSAGVCERSQRGHEWSPHRASVPCSMPCCRVYDGVSLFYDDNLKIR